MTGVCKQYLAGGSSKSLKNNLRQWLYSTHRDPFECRVAFHTADHLAWHEMASVCIVLADNWHDVLTPGFKSCVFGCSGVATRSHKVVASSCRQYSKRFFLLLLFQPKHFLCNSCCMFLKISVWLYYFLRTRSSSTSGNWSFICQ